MHKVRKPIEHRGFPSQFIEGNGGLSGEPSLDHQDTLSKGLGSFGSNDALSQPRYQCLLRELPKYRHRSSDASRSLCLVRTPTLSLHSSIIKTSRYLVK